MKIITREIKIKNTNSLNTEYIESEMKKLGIVPLRWAIVNADENCLVVSAAYEVNL